MFPVTVAAGRLEVETPDHVLLRYDLAGAGNRGFAALLDFTIVLVIVLTMVFVLAGLAVLTGDAFVSLGAVLILSVALIAAYFVLLEWLWNGQTIGKRWFGLRVITEDGSPAPFTAVLVRNLLRAADFLPAFYGIGVLVIILSPRSQRLGDLAAGTFVVRAPRPRVDWLSLRTLTPLGPGRVAETRRLPGEAQRLVREFVAREGSLAPAERAKIAALIAGRLRAYTLDAGSADDVELIHEIARSLRESGRQR
ncbi:MAG: RDD family protein [Chloroflexi bacterium]|nr:MAG: RDD family protein [Chloroflexota bacterium]